MTAGPVEGRVVGQAQVAPQPDEGARRARSWHDEPAAGPRRGIAAVTRCVVRTRPPTALVSSPSEECTVNWDQGTVEKASPFARRDTREAGSQNARRVRRREARRCAPRRRIVHEQSLQTLRELTARDAERGHLVGQRLRMPLAQPFQRTDHRLATRQFCAACIGTEFTPSRKPHHDHAREDAEQDLRNDGSDEKSRSMAALGLEHDAVDDEADNSWRRERLRTYSRPWMSASVTMSPLAT